MVDVARASPPEDMAAGLAAPEPDPEPEPHPDPHPDPDPPDLPCLPRDDYPALLLDLDWLELLAAMHF